MTGQLRIVRRRILLGLVASFSLATPLAAEDAGDRRVCPCPCARSDRSGPEQASEWRAGLTNRAGDIVGLLRGESRAEIVAALARIGARTERADPGRLAPSRPCCEAACVVARTLQGEEAASRSAAAAARAAWAGPVSEAAALYLDSDASLDPLRRAEIPEPVLVELVEAANEAERDLYALDAQLALIEDTGVVVEPDTSDRTAALAASGARLEAAREDVAQRRNVYREERDRLARSSGKHRHVGTCYRECSRVDAQQVGCKLLISYFATSRDACRSSASSSANWLASEHLCEVRLNSYVVVSRDALKASCPFR